MPASDWYAPPCPHVLASPSPVSRAPIPRGRRRSGPRTGRRQVPVFETAASWPVGQLTVKSAKISMPIRQQVMDANVAVGRTGFGNRRGTDLKPIGFEKSEDRGGNAF